jgi:hypothetical protein
MTSEEMFRPADIIGFVLFRCDKCKYAWKEKMQDAGSWFENCPRCDEFCEHDSYILLVYSKDKDIKDGKEIKNT